MNRPPTLVVYYTVIVLAGLLGFALCSKWMGSRSAAAYDRTLDSLQRGWEGTRADLSALRSFTDSVKAHTDSTVATFPPAPVVRERALKLMEYAPLQTAVDTLNAE